MLEDAERQDWPRMLANAMQKILRLLPEGSLASKRRVSSVNQERVYMVIAGFQLIVLSIG